MSERFSDEILEEVRKAKAAGATGHYYIVLPTDDGGASYHKRCTVCGEIGNILARTFPHADDCPLR